MLLYVVVHRIVPAAAGTIRNIHLRYRDAMNVRPEASQHIFRRIRFTAGRVNSIYNISNSALVRAAAGRAQ
jgi:hypothetical protein